VNSYQLGELELSIDFLTAQASGDAKYAQSAITKLLDYLQDGEVTSHQIRMLTFILENIVKDKGLCKKVIYGKSGRPRNPALTSHQVGIATSVLKFRKLGNSLKGSPDNPDKPGAFYLAAEEFFGSHPPEEKIRYVRHCWESHKKLAIDMSEGGPDF
jgi:hypothetical protein